jgi:hypothetical protein
VVVTADVAEIPVGIDGETVKVTTPARCRIRPGALRVRLPRDRPGVRPPGTRLHWATVWALAAGRPVAVGTPSPAPAASSTGSTG